MLAKSPVTSATGSMLRAIEHAMRLGMHHTLAAMLPVLLPLKGRWLLCMLETVLASHGMTSRVSSTRAGLPALLATVRRAHGEASPRHLRLVAQSSRSHA